MKLELKWEGSLDHSVPLLAGFWVQVGFLELWLSDDHSLKVGLSQFAGVPSVGAELIHLGEDPV